MVEYQAFHCMETGFSHLKTGCEDYAGSYNGSEVRIAVISDGHGDKACMRSSIGSRYAVEVAVENMKEFAARLCELNWQSRLMNPVEREALLRQLIRSIIGNWNLKVLQQLQENPLTEEELSVQHRYTEAYRQGQHLTHIFGCTLIASMILDHYLVVLHHGDGRCVVLHQDGTADQPVPWDDMCVGNVTTSVCQPDAVDRCRYYVCDLDRDRIVGCFVTSDGIEDSMEDLPDQNALGAYFSDVAARAALQGIPALQEEMKQELPLISQYGSHDDTSFGALLDLEAAEKMAERLSLAYEMYKYSAEERQVQKKLNSMQRKMEYLREDVTQAEKNRTEADSHCRSIGHMLERLMDKLAEIREAQENSVRAKTEAEERFAKARAAYEEYSATHEGYQKMGQEARSKVEQIRRRLEELMRMDKAAEENADPLPEAESPAEIPPEEKAAPQEVFPGEDSPDPENKPEQEKQQDPEENPASAEAPAPEEVITPEEEPEGEPDAQQAEPAGEEPSGENAPEDDEEDIPEDDEEDIPEDNEEDIPEDDDTDYGSRLILPD